MIAEILSVGTELLLGEIVDTNASHLSSELAAIGIDVYHRQTVGDNLARLTEALRTALNRAEVVIVTGGLGPTEDDLTREAIAAATDSPLVRIPASEQHLREFFAARGRPLAQSNLRQADAPTGAIHLENVCGTAPGIFMRWQDRLIFAAPGPPTELCEMTRRSIIPLLCEAQGKVPRLYTRSLLLADIGESQVADLLADLISRQADPTLALYASPGQVRLRLATKATSEAEAQARLGPVEAQAREILEPYVFGNDDETMASAVGQLLRLRGATLAVAESCTGGLIASRLTDVPGASEYFLAGLVTYSNEAKSQLLGVDPEIIATHGAVSEACARAMATGARRVSGADYALATTGIAGPGGATADKPLGLVYLAVADEAGGEVWQQVWPSTREQFKARVTQLALGLLRRRLVGLESVP